MSSLSDQHSVREYIRDRTPFFGSLIIIFICGLFIFGLFGLREHAEEEFVADITDLLNTHTTKVYNKGWEDGRKATTETIYFNGTNKVLDMTVMDALRVSGIKKYNEAGGI